MRSIKALLLPLWAALALLGCALPARATILFAGGEDIDFVFGGTVSITTGAGLFRSGYARSGLITVGAAADPPTVYIDTPAFTAQSTIWVHAENFQSVTSGTTSGASAVIVFGSDGVRRLEVRGTGTAGQVKISTRNTAGTFVDLVTCTASTFPYTTTLTKLDWFVNYAVSGHTTLYANGIQICDYSGDVTTNSVNQVNKVEFSGAGAGLNNTWSEIIVSTTDTRDMNLFTCAPQANGTNQTWTGTASNVNPTTINDASSITTGTNNAIAEFTCPSLPTGIFTVPAIVQAARIQIGASGPQNFRYIARPSSGSTDYDSGSDILGSLTFTSYTGQIWATNPATSTSWSTGDLGTGVNFGLKSRP